MTARTFGRFVHSYILRNILRNVTALLAGRGLVCAALLAGAATGLAAGCESERRGEGAASPPAEAGFFEAQVGGALRDTLRGAATARFDSTGRLAGVELDGASDTTQTGFSFELAARASGRQPYPYTISSQEGGREDTSFALMNAYLRLRGYQFAARAGSLRIERDSTGLRGTFGLRLRGTVEAASDEAATLTARGHFAKVPRRRP